MERRPQGAVGLTMASAEKLQLAREFRQSATAAEALAWTLLRNRRLLGLKFRRQQPLFGFVADFYCAELQLILELDGGVHASQQAQDNQRTRCLEQRGLRVVRLENHEVSRERLAALVKPLLSDERKD